MEYTSLSALTAAIREQISTRDNQAISAMLKIYQWQTDDEKISETTSHSNGVGFAGTDAEILSSFCKQYQERHFLSPKQMAILKKKISKYAGQLVRHAIDSGIYIKKGRIWVIAK